jgi:hypothetical protein
MAKLDPSKQTTFLLGAGASQPYGFPLGMGLRQQLGNYLPQPNERFSEEVIRDFQEVLHGSLDGTIDTLLERKKRFREIGAWAIAHAIAPCEDHGRLFPPRDWYAVLFDWLALSAPHSERPKVSFVTLNYDRSLEHFLSKNIQINLRDDEEDLTRSALAEIPFIHPHGSLGKYPDVPYRLMSPMMDQAAASIRIISDHLEDKLEFGTAVMELQKAEQVVVIGFGWDPRTASALFPDVGEKQFLFVSGFGLGEDRKELIRQTRKERVYIGGLQVPADHFFRAITG